jgi:iron complex outermembrane recepter protein
MTTMNNWLLAFALAVPASTLAQTATPQGVGDSGRRTVRKEVEEIIVTAQRRAQRLQDVPIAASALSGADLDQSAERGVAEALNRIPGVVNLPLGGNERFGGHTNVVIRGVAPGTATNSSPTAYYLDSIPFGFVRRSVAPDSSAFDLERVEVLRGPQGTLYGSSALNGVVRVLTRDADLNDFEIKARTSIAGTEDGSETYRGDAAVNMPIVEGKLAARAVFGYQDVGGWVNKPGEADANDRRVRTARVKINAQPTDELSIGLFGWLSRSDIGAPSYSPDNKFSPLPLAEPASIDYDAYGMKVVYDFPGVSLTSMTSYIDFADRSTLDLAAFNVTGVSLATRFGSEVFAQEINLSSTHGGSWRWTLGGIYRDAEEFQWQARSTALAPNMGDTTSESFAVFGELTRVFSDGRFELTGGLRYFEDRVQDIERSASVAGGVPVGGLAVTPVNTFDSVSPRVVATWHPGDNSSLYISYAEGFRSGINQVPQVTRVAPQYPPADPDELKNYEIGAKGSLWNGRVNLDMAVFYIDWQGVQQSFTQLVAAPNVIEGVLLNAGSASGAGFEFGITAMPTDQLSLGINVSWNDLQVDDDLFNASGVLVIGKGDRPAESAETTVGATAAYQFALGQGGWNVHLSAGANYVSELIVAQPIGLPPGIRGSTVVSRASFAVESPRRWITSIFAENLGNERGFARDPFSPRWNTYLRPRTIGLQLDYQF